MPKSTRLRQRAERKPVAERVTPHPGLTLDTETLSLAEAAKRVDMSKQTLLEAVRSGALEAYIPRGVEPGRIGRGPGYQVTFAELERWFLGKPKGDKP